MADLTKEKFRTTASERITKTLGDFRDWRVGAKDDYAFIAGNQWLQSDEAILKAQKRPPITFNYSEKMIDAVVGAEVSNRQEVTYRPRTVEDAGQAEVWNSAAKWARQECNAEDEESDAFRDMLICGIGWTHTRMNYDEDQDGKIMIDRIDPLEMFYDGAANKPGLTDRRFNFRQWWVDKTEAEREWPGKAIDGGSNSDNLSGGVITRGHRYLEDDEDEIDRHIDQVLITFYECVEQEPVWRVATANSIQEIPSAKFNKLRKSFDKAGMKYIKQYKRVYYRGFFAGDTILEFGQSPCQNGFTFQAITGKRDRNKNIFYGITRVMKDPQRWANKWLSQILHIINSNAKGGLLAEVNAFVDPRKAADEWSQPESITLLNEGGLNKVEQKTPTQYPAGLDKLMTFALGSLPMVTGINLEALGLANREQANVLEMSRKQAAYGLLSPLFDGLRRYRKIQGKVMLYFIHEYISDGRLIRIGGAESQQFIPLTKQADAPEYDIIVDQSPTAPDTKEQTWETLQAIIPTAIKTGMPLPPNLLDYAPIPVGLATEWKKFIQQQKQQPQIPPQIQQQMQKMQQEIQQLQQENTGLKQDQQVDMLTLQQKSQQSQAELSLKATNAKAELEMKRAIADQEFALEAYKQDREFELAQRQAGFDNQLQHSKVAGDFAIKEKAVEVATKPVKDLALSIDMKPIADAIANVSKDHNNALESLTKALGRPRKLIKDANGQPIGSEPA